MQALNQTAHDGDQSWRRFVEPLVPLISLLAVVIPIALKNPNVVVTYRGLTILLSMAVPIMIATMAQMMAMAIGEIDFSLGNLVSLVTCIVGTILPARPGLAAMMLAGIVVVYMLVGAFVHLKNMPSIIVTIGLSFIWLGIAVIIQPRPGGDIPGLITGVVRYRPPLVPMPIVFAVLLAVVGHFLVFKTNFGILMRGVGDNVKSIRQAGHSVLAVRVLVFGLVGVFGILAGVALAGATTSADSQMARNYTLLAVSGVILGGGTFSGGKVSAAGAVMGALTMHLVTYLLVSYKLPTDWQAGAQGLTILLVLYVGGVFRSGRKVHYV